MLSTSAGGATARRMSTSRLLVTAALAASSMALVLPSRADDDQRFFVLDNPGDANFNQLLGINNAQVIVGYFGDGAVVANNGYVLVPPNHYAPENVANAAQTQAIGINDKTFPHIVGFFTDSATGFTHGFLDADGTETAIDDPRGSPPNVTTPVQNLLGINDRDQAAGFWTETTATRMVSSSTSTSTRGLRRHSSRFRRRCFAVPSPPWRPTSPTPASSAVFGRMTKATTTASSGLLALDSPLSMSASEA